MEKNVKRILRYLLFLVCAVYGAVNLMGEVLLRLFIRVGGFGAWSSRSEASTIGIIGGADGPTAVFVTTSGWTAYVLPVLALVVGICGLVWLRKNR